MSLARQQFLEDLAGLSQAIALDPLAQGSSGLADNRGLVILRRGMLITSLIALETFVRDRIVEVLGVLSTWPASFQDLPAKLREAALLESLNNLQRFARMLKRQEDDYEGFIIGELNKMARTSGPVYGFSQFVSGDYTGNLSDTGLRDLLSSFQVKDCWNTFRTLCADIGMGVPSVHELVKSVVRNRHKSAHSPTFVPTVADVRGTPLNLTRIGLCFDAAITSAATFALHDWEKWSAGQFEWRDALQLYYVDPHQSKFRLLKHGRNKALRIVNSAAEANPYVPVPAAGKVAIVIHRDATQQASNWAIL